MSYGRAPPDVEGMTSLKVDNLTYRTSPETLRRVFEKYGRVGDVYIPRDRYTKESRGFAFVRFLDKRDAEDAWMLWTARCWTGGSSGCRWPATGDPRTPCTAGEGLRRADPEGVRRTQEVNTIVDSRSASPRRRRRSRSRSRSKSRSRSRSRHHYSRSRSHSDSRSRSRSKSKSRTPRRSKTKSPSKSRSSRSRSRTPPSNRGSKSRSRSKSKSRPKSPEDNGAEI
ncbi:hypothetical protein F7725_014493 [Dissostichus mawsoni]|uniref:RRM domain-containing protein n=1 Tax=Dissostichus mawsoni TaxID=36200 RepID=A0A7J5YWA9_DISMA|nr:hypothetical protein F7725_014493 [Dissostichus mawsoni]